MDSKRDQDERQQYQGRDYQDQRYDRRDLAPQDNLRGGYQERNFGDVQDQQNDQRYDMRNAYDGRYDMHLQDRQLYQQQERGRGNIPVHENSPAFRNEDGYHHQDRAMRQPRFYDQPRILECSNGVSFNFTTNNYQNSGNKY